MASLLALAACTEGLDKPSELKDLRVLAIRAEPAEVLDVNASVEVTFDALVVDPQGGQLTYTWGFCPLASSVACADYDALLAQSDAAIDSALDAMELDETSRAVTEALVGAEAIDAKYRVAESTSSAEINATPTALAPFATLPLTLGLDPLALPPQDDCPLPPVSDLHLFHFLANPLQMLVGALPSAILQASANGRSIVAQKRLPLGISDPAALIACGGTADLGFEICTEEADGCVALRPRAANANPVFESIAFADSKEATAPFAVVTDFPYTMPAGSSIRIRPAFTTSSSETYTVLDSNLQTREIFVRPAVEEMAVSWFVSAGEVDDELTWPKFTKTLDTVYTAPSEPPAATEGLVSVWMVARDGRGGVAWQEVRLRIEP